MTMNTILSWLLKALDYWLDVAEEEECRNADGLARGIDGWANMLEAYMREHAAFTEEEGVAVRGKVMDTLHVIDSMPGLSDDKKKELAERLAKVSGVAIERTL